MQNKFENPSQQSSEPMPLINDFDNKKVEARTVKHEEVETASLVLENSTAISDQLIGLSAKQSEETTYLTTKLEEENSKEENRVELDSYADVENETELFASPFLDLEKSDVRAPEKMVQTSAVIDQPNENTPLINNKSQQPQLVDISSDEEDFEEEDLESLETRVDVENATRVYDKLISILEKLEKLENNTNNSLAWLVPVNTSTSIFPEFVSPEERLSSSAATALAISLANSLIAVWENYNTQNKIPQKCCSFKSLVDFIKSPIGAPVCSYTMLLCFKTMGDFAPQLPDNASMLSLIGALFAVSIINGVVTQLGSNSQVNPESRITRRDVANGVIAGVTAAGFIAQIDRILKMNMDPTTYETFGPYMLPLEAAVGLVYGVARVFIPAFLKSKESLTSEEDIALSMMNKAKKNWDNFNKHVRFTGNLIYISGLAIESKKLLDLDVAIGVIAAVTAGPIVATAIDALASSCSNKQKVSGLVTGKGINSPVFGRSINNSDEPVTQEKELPLGHASSLV